MDAQSEYSISQSTPGPESNISQLQSSAFRIRIQTSWVHKHSQTKKRGDISYMHCNYCSKQYVTSGCTDRLAGHLEKRRGLKPNMDSVTYKRDANDTAVNTALLRHAEFLKEMKIKEEA